MKDIAFFLPTRRGSQRVKNKNTRNFGDISGGLLELKLRQLIKVRGIDEIILSTNDPESMEIASRFKDGSKKISIIERPDQLASNTALVVDLIRYIPEIVRNKHIFWTHVTAPFVTAEIYEKAIDKYFEVLKAGHHDSILSVTKFQQFLWSEETNDIINRDKTHNKWPNTQDLKPLYEINHAFYISSRENYLNLNDRIGKKPYLFKLGKIHSVDIDTEDDFKIAEAVYNTSFRDKQNHIPAVKIDPRGPIQVFLPCRKGSERVVNKNIREFSNFPSGLVELKLRQLIKVNEFEQIIISTNDNEIISMAEQIHDSRIMIDHRRDELCRSETSTDELINYVPEIVKSGHVVWTHVTSPFIDAEDYENAIIKYKKSLTQGFDSLMSVSRIQKFLFEQNAKALNFNRNVEKWPRTQTIKPYFESNSGYFISHISNYLKFGDRIGGNVFMDEIDKLKSFDIDWEEDFLIAETIYEKIILPSKQ